MPPIPPTQPPTPTHPQVCAPHLDGLVVVLDGLHRLGDVLGHARLAEGGHALEPAVRHHRHDARQDGHHDAHRPAGAARRDACGKWQAAVVLCHRAPSTHMPAHTRACRDTHIPLPTGCLSCPTHPHPPTYRHTTHARTHACTSSHLHSLTPLRCWSTSHATPLPPTHTHTHSHTHLQSLTNLRYWSTS